MKKMWSGRFAQDASKLLEQFNASIMFDRKLYREDIEGSVAHAQMLAHQGILSQAELTSIEKGMAQVLEEIESGVFEWKIADEDLHMAIEKRLTEIIGEAGKKLHTARSRNDQVALDFRRYVLRKNGEIVEQIKEVMGVLVDIARNHTSTLLPGMTHLQHAQPINFAFHLLAYVSMFKRDCERFESSAERNNISPIGCAALAGTPHNINREMTAQSLGFHSVSINCLDTVSDRDFALEILFNISTLMMHVSRLAEEIILWSSYEFRFVELSDEYSTGSSIMPQKKNPDVPELVRGKTGRVNGHLVALLTLMKGQPLAYNKDNQEDKEPLFDTVDTLVDTLTIYADMLTGVTVKPDAMRAAVMQGFATATDLADYLVKKGLPFRDAHEVVARAVRAAEASGRDLADLSLAELQAFSSMIADDVYAVLTLEGSLAARDHLGGTAPKQVRAAIERARKRI